MSKVSRLSTHRPALTTWAALVGMMSAYAVIAGTMALRRHANLQSQALDMGYADQITWNMLHGRFFHFTLFRGQVGAELGQPLQYGPGADRDSLFAYHVELLFLPLSLLYLIHPGPETLIVLLTLVLALGAIPVYLIARRRLRHRAAALAFAAVYLLTPSVQAANLADFHIVSMAPTFLFTAIYFLITGRTRAFLVAAVLCALLKEEVGLLVAAMGLYLWIVRGERRLGIAVAGVSLAWVAFCFGIVIPHYTGGAPSLFATRYADAIHHVRILPQEWLAGRWDAPLPQYTAEYLWNMLASTSFLALLAPFQLALAVPALAVNGLSGSVWQHGGGAHYSAEAVPGLLFAAICAVSSLAGLGWRRFKLPPATTVLALSLVVLGAALAQAWAQGALPPARRFAWIPDNGRLAELQPLLVRIPPDAPLSVQSDIFPHLSERERIYVFPAIEDAQYVLVDVSGNSDPLYPDQLLGEATTLLSNTAFTLVDGVDGFLLFQRQPGAEAGVGAPAPLPDAFYRFAHPAPGERYTPAAADFGPFEVLGYRAEWVPEVNFAVRRVMPVIYVRAHGNAGRDYRLTLFRLGSDNLARIHDDGNATQLWYPTYRWQAGETIALRYPPLTYGAGEHLGLGAQIGTDANVPRLPVTSATLTLADSARVAILGRLP